MIGTSEWISYPIQRREFNLRNSNLGRWINQTFSNRVARAEFDKYWTTSLTRSGYVIYTAIANHAEVEVLLNDGSSKLLVFKKGGQVIVGGGGVSHYSKPHYSIDL